MVRIGNPASDSNRSFVGPHGISRCPTLDPRSLAHVDDLRLPALLALDHAAPDDLAVTRLLHPAVLHVVAPPAADGLAGTVLGAHPAPCPRRVAAPPTEARRLLHVGQLSASERGHVGAQESVPAPVAGPPLGQLGLARGLVCVGKGLLGLLVLALENVADGMEGSELQPAGLDCAGARHAVTLARRVHLVLHHLDTARTSVTARKCQECGQFKEQGIRKKAEGGEKR